MSDKAMNLYHILSKKHESTWEKTSTMRTYNTTTRSREKNGGRGGDLSLPHATGIWSMKASNDYAVLMENLLITNIL